MFRHDARDQDQGPRTRDQAKDQGIMDQGLGTRGHDVCDAERYDERTDGRAVERAVGTGACPRAGNQWGRGPGPRTMRGGRGTGQGRTVGRTVGWSGKRSGGMTDGRTVGRTVGWPGGLLNGMTNGQTAGSGRAGGRHRGLVNVKP